MMSMLVECLDPMKDIEFFMTIEVAPESLEKCHYHIGLTRALSQNIAKAMNLDRSIVEVSVTQPNEKGFTMILAIITNESQENVLTRERCRDMLERYQKKQNKICCLRV